MRQETRTNKRSESTMSTMQPNTNTTMRNAKAMPAKSNSRQPSREEIARKAYHYFLDRGGAHGHDKEDWYRAEQDLMKNMR